MAAASSAPLLSFSSFSFDVPTLPSQTHAIFPLFSSTDQSEHILSENDAAMQLIDKLDELWFWGNVLTWQASGQSQGQAVHAMVDAHVVSHDGIDRESVPSSPLTICKVHDEELLTPGFEKLKPKEEAFDPRMEDKGDREECEEEVAGNLDLELKTEKSNDHPTIKHQEDQKLLIETGENENEQQSGLTSQKERHKAVTSGKPPLQTINSGRQILTEMRSGISLTRRRRRVRIKRIKSQIDLEYDEVKGFKDLGFNFREDELTPGIVSLVPGLKPHNRESTESTNLQSETSPIQRLYPSEGWWTSKRKREPPLQNWRIPDPRGEGIDMKEQLKFWAHIVASNVRQEC
ncbi:hypothetical protein O6H91_02G048600 [Diphasiastrum complanatum]|uniref:Uncharacterized protein n=1 Tax=Diphasiastrum complanatum TaxID=34168 RepID=A0ACC2EF66_DIPCM|nr:hypothetical protein O6H91_02G048600 [Diphasiastrum complanatum]